MIDNKKILAVVTARKGSKGIPGKNYRDLLGKPLFLWSMEAALQSEYVDTVVLSSNCEECEKLHIEWTKTLEKKEQDRVIFWLRPDALATDTAKNELALIHVLMACEKGYGLKHDIVVNLQPTSPCRVGRLLDRCIEEYNNGGHDSLLTASKITPFLWRRKNGKWTYSIDKNDCCERKMRQEFENNDENSEFLMHDNGCVYVTDSRILLDTECRIGYNPCVFETIGINNIQIDEEIDFVLIEKMLEAMKLDSPIQKEYK